MSTAPVTRDPEIVATVAGLVDDIVGGADLLGIEITEATTFHEDLLLESVDLVTLVGMLTDVYGPQVNLAERLADLDLEQIVALSVGDVADLVGAAVHGPR